jgi:hypothetical protein
LCKTTFSQQIMTSRPKDRKRKSTLTRIIERTYTILYQRCPTHSPLATCGEWRRFVSQKRNVLNKIKMLGTKITI